MPDEVTDVAEIDISQVPEYAVQIEATGAAFGELMDVQDRLAAELPQLAYQILLAACRGGSPSVIAQSVGCSHQLVSATLRRYDQELADLRRAFTAYHNRTDAVDVDRAVLVWLRNQVLIPKLVEQAMLLDDPRGILEYMREVSDRTGLHKSTEVVHDDSQDIRKLKEQTKEAVEQLKELARGNPSALSERPIDADFTKVTDGDP